MGYDAFISYSHGADLELAPVMRTGLQKLAKPWNRRRALKIFLDQSSLELSSELGSSLDERLSDTEWLVLCMSEVSAKSKWVGEEIREWAEAKSKDRMALVLTSGEVVWDDQARDFDYERSTAVNDGMRGIYTGQDSEPLFLDLRWTKDVPDGEKTLDLDHPKFRDAIATVAAPLHNKTKDELEGEDIRQHKRLVLLRRLAIAALTLLTIAAVVGALIALDQKSKAQEEARRAESRALASDALNKSLPEADLAALLALEGVRVANTADARGSLAEVLSAPTRFLQRTDEHQAPISAIAFGEVDESGGFAASADVTGVVRIWELNGDPFVTPQAVPTVDAFELGVAVQELFVVQDGEEVVLVAFDARGDLHVIDLLSGEAVVVAPPDEFMTTALSPDGALVAGITLDGVLRVYETDFADENADNVIFDQVSDSVQLEGAVATDLTFSPDGSELAWAQGNEVNFWRWLQASDISFWGFETDVTSISFSPDGSPADAVIAVGEEDGAIWLFNRQETELTDIVNLGAVNTLFDLSFKPQVDDDGGFTLASAHSNGDVILWSVLPDPGFPPFGFEIAKLQGHKDENLKVAFSPDGRIASGDFEGEVLWWIDVAAPFLGTDRRTPEDLVDMVDAAFAGPNLVVSLDRNSTVWAWNLDVIEPTILRDESDVSAVDAASGIVALGLLDGSALVLNANGDVTQVLADGHEAAIERLALSPAGDRIASIAQSASEGIARLITWEPAGSRLYEVNLPPSFEPSSMLQAADGSVWIGGLFSDERLPVVLKVDASGRLLPERLAHGQSRGNTVLSLAVSDDGRILATGGSDRRIQLWDVPTMTRVKGSEFRGHRDNVTGIVFWDQGETLISSDEDGAVIMWDVSDRRDFGSLQGPTDALTSLVVDHDSATLVGASEDNSLWSWSLEPEDWRARACGLAGRNMTSAEWERYGDGKEMVRHCPEWSIDASAPRDAEFSDVLVD